MADGFESTIITSGGILSLIIIPIILFTVACCATKKKANFKVAFTKQEGTFKVTIIQPPNDPAEDTDALKQNHSDKTEATMNTLTPGTVIVPNCDELHIHKLSASPVMPKRISSDVVISPNPSYTVEKSNEDKFTLSESLYIYCEQPSTGEEDKALHGVNERSNALHVSDDTPMNPVRYMSDNRAAQTFEDSIQQTVIAVREECGNALYGVSEYNNALYAGGDGPIDPVSSYSYIPGKIHEHRTQQTSDGSQECSNALYEAREYDGALHTGDDVKMNRNPSYSMMPNELTHQNTYKYIAGQTYEDQNDGSNNSMYGVRECDNALYISNRASALTRSTSYDYIPPQPFEDSLQQVVNGGGRKECNNALYEAREYENVDHDVPGNPDHKAVLTRSTSQNSYDYVYEAYDDDAMHDYSFIDSVEVSGTLYQHQDYINVNRNVVNRAYPNPSYGHKVTMLANHN